MSSLDWFRTRRPAEEVSLRSPEAHCRQGLGYEERGEIAKAIEEYERALRLDANSVLAHFSLGSIQYHKKQRADDAITHFQQALRIDPSFAPARSQLAFVYMQQGRLEEAVAQWEEAISRGAEGSTLTDIRRWLDEAKPLLAQRKKPIDEISSTLRSHLENLGIRSKEWYVAYDALKRIGPGSVEALIVATTSTNHLLRLRALDLLGAIGDERALEPLKRAAEIRREDFLRITSTPLPVLLPDGKRIGEVSVSDQLEEYRAAARKVLEAVQNRLGRS